MVWSIAASNMPSTSPLKMTMTWRLGSGSCSIRASVPVTPSIRCTLCKSGDGVSNLRHARVPATHDESRRSRRVPTTSSTIPPTTSFTATIHSVTSRAVCDVSVVMLVGSFRS